MIELKKEIDNTMKKNKCNKGQAVAIVAKRYGHCESFICKRLASDSAIVYSGTIYVKAKR